MLLRPRLNCRFAGAFYKPTAKIRHYKDTNKENAGKLIAIAAFKSNLRTKANHMPAIASIGNIKRGSGQQYFSIYSAGVTPLTRLNTTKKLDGFLKPTLRPRASMVSWPYWSRSLRRRQTSSMR